MEREEKINKIIDYGYRRRRLNVFGSLGLPRPMEVSVLKTLEFSKDGSMGISNIAKSLKLTLPNVSRAVKQMEKEGKVERFAGKADLRSTIVKITDYGREYVKESIAAFTDFMYKAIDRLSEKDIDAYLKVSEKLYLAYNEELESRKKK
ncbi:MAG: MarR family transcriptional regulator [Clostridia bacterium]|nr:MarR family transcriptional regulator [Clostridia bacterium]